MLTFVGLLLPAAYAAAEPITPSSDAEVIEVLPAAAGDRGEDRRMRKLLTARPSDERLAVAVAKRDLQRAREAGDPRFAGLALAALAHWPDATTTPDDVLLLRATLQQYLHDFDTAIASLRLLVARPSGARIAQAWLTLATVYRVQGHYAESNEACRSVAQAGASLHAQACLAENAGLKGDVAMSRKAFAALLDGPGLDDGTRGWLLTSVAELEERDAKPKSAEAAFKAVLALGPEAYAAVDYADFLIDQARPCEVMPLLKDEVRTDAVLLRLAIAGVQCTTPSAAPNAARDVAEMRDRIALANQRPDASVFHGREQAMFALLVDRAPARALALARGNAARQREAIDLLVFAQAARAAQANGNPAGLDEVKKLQQSIGLHDRRVDALL